MWPWNQMECYVLGDFGESVGIIVFFIEPSFALGAPLSFFLMQLVLFFHFNRFHSLKAH